MKKLKKLKIIEEGRICSSEEMKSIVGGSGFDCSSGFTSCTSKYTSCPGSTFTTCHETGFAGYGSGGGSTACSSGFSYTSCSSIIILGSKSVCGSSMSYTS